MSLEDIESSQESPLSPKSSSIADGQEIQTPDIETKTKTLSDSPQKSNVESNVGEKEPIENQHGTADIYTSETEKELYNEVLEKLDIIKNKQKIQESDMHESFEQEKLKQESYPNTIKDFGESQVETQIKTAISQDFGKIQELVKAGLINSIQGQNLKNQVLKKAFDKLVQTEKIKRALVSASQNNGLINTTANQETDKNKIFEEFSKSNPDFFSSDGRKEVLNYLKSGNVNLGKDELGKISNIIRTVEKAAIDRYLQKVAHEKTLKNSNESAKQRLTANAQKSGSSGNFSKTFTREQIGKMSSAEFTKYEPAIMEQLKKGHIR